MNLPELQKTKYQSHCIISVYVRSKKNAGHKDRRVVLAFDASIQEAF